LYRLVAPKLFGLALSILRREDWAEEVLQESFFTIWLHAADYNPEKGSVLTWMANIVRNRALDVRRRTQHETAIEPEDPGRDEGLWSDSGVSPRRSLTQTAEAQALLDCLEHLQAQQQQSILLVYFHGFTHAELAQQMETPLGTVKTWIRRGLEQIRKCLDHEI
jgi:RNA polymerase sigma-70 factor (ECF subfamily)